LPGLYTVSETYPGDGWVPLPETQVLVLALDVCPEIWAGNTYQPTDPTDAVENVISAIEDLHVQTGIENSLISKLENTINALNTGDTADAMNKLGAFINEVEAQQCKKIPCDDADELIAMVQQIIDSVGG